MHDAIQLGGGVACLVLTTFYRLDELGLVATGQRMDSDRAADLMFLVTGFADLLENMMSLVCSNTDGSSLEVRGLQKRRLRYLVVIRPDHGSEDS